MDAPHHFLRKGKTNSITDVAGVTVGHETLDEGDVQTGVTAILPHQGNIFKDKVTAASHVINGFGKTAGLVQLEELGSLETPILLSNTLAVGACFDALVDYSLERNEDIGRTTGTVNPVVGECNDMFVNDIRKRSITPRHTRKAIEAAGPRVEEGAVGAGRGMMCYSMKGGIGSSSRLIESEGTTYTLGILVLSNFGLMKDLTVHGQAVGNYWSSRLSQQEDTDKGSIMMIVATDLPLSHRQLKRVLKRTVTGMARTGSVINNGSGDIAIGFSTASPSSGTIDDYQLEDAFRAIGEATEEAILRSLTQASPVTGRNGFRPPVWKELMERYPYDF